MRVDTDIIAARSQGDLLRRNAIFEEFFADQAPRLARASQEMSQRFLAGGRLLAFGRDAATTDAQHVSVEFVHPVIVGKRALPALDLGPEFYVRLPVLVEPHDMVMGFGFLGRDATIDSVLREAGARGALTFALFGSEAEYAFSPPDDDPFIRQEIAEVLYHLLWETVHVYFEHREQGHDVGASSFLYPFLGRQEQTFETVVEEVQGSMLQKASEVNGLRAYVAEAGVEAMAVTARAIAERLARGGKVIAFGNGGSATDANDLMIDCVSPPEGLRAIPALSLAWEPANITAVANDIGSEAIFARQLIAHGHPQDVAIAISTSGSSPNILAALQEARRRGLLTVSLAGYDGGKVVRDGLADHALVVHSDYIPRIQEAQASVYHVLRRQIDDLMQGGERHA